MARNTRKLRSPRGKIATVHEVMGGRVDLSMNALFRLDAALAERSRERQKEGTAKASTKAAVRKRERTRARLKRERQKARAREPLKEKRGKYRPGVAVLPRHLEILAAWPDPDGEWFVPDMCAALPFLQRRSVESAIRVTKVRGWTTCEARYREETVAPCTPAKRFAPWAWRLTAEGRAARAWVRWIRARCILGCRAPQFGKEGRFMPYWIRGLDWSRSWMTDRKSRSVPHMGYLPDAPEAAPWPELGLWGLSPEVPEPLRVDGCPGIP